MSLSKAMILIILMGILCRKWWSKWGLYNRSIIKERKLCQRKIKLAIEILWHNSIHNTMPTMQWRQQTPSSTQKPRMRNYPTIQTLTNLTTHNQTKTKPKPKITCTFVMNYLNYKTSLCKPNNEQENYQNQSVHLVVSGNKLLDHSKTIIRILRKYNQMMNLHQLTRLVETSCLKIRVCWEDKNN